MCMYFMSKWSPIDWPPMLGSSSDSEVHSLRVIRKVLHRLRQRITFKAAKFCYLGLHHWKWRKSRVTLFGTFSTSPLACWCCFSTNLYPETLLYTAEHYNLYVHIDFWSKFSLLCWTAPCWLLTGRETRNCQNLRYFRHPHWKTKSW